MKPTTAQQVLNNINLYIEDAEAWNKDHHYVKKNWKTRDVCDNLSIFDWWVDELGLSHLKSMKMFVENAIKMGFDGFVCFKVGAKYCASGMWAYKAESTDGYSPKGEALYRSFYPSGNWWDVCDENEKWLATGVYDQYDKFKTLAQLKKAMKEQ